MEPCNSTGVAVRRTKESSAGPQKIARWSVPVSKLACFGATARSALGPVVVEEKVEHHPDSYEKPLHVPARLARVLDLGRHRIHARSASAQLLF